MSIPKEFDMIDFQGGLYAVAADIDQKTDTEFMKKEVDIFYCKIVLNVILHVQSWGISLSLLLHKK